jgi:hypothetical protein
MPSKNKIIKFSFINFINRKKNIAANKFSINFFAIAIDS